MEFISTIYIHFIDFLTFLCFCSPFILFLALIIAPSIFFVRHLTKNERQKLEEPQNKELWIKSKKAALGFKIATIIFSSIPLLLLIPFACEPADNGYGDAAFAILLGVSIAVFLSSFSAVYCYNFLFYVADNKTATIILFIPLFPLILCSAAFPPLIIPCAIFVLIARAILMSKRKRFYKAIEDSKIRIEQQTELESVHENT